MSDKPSAEDESIPDSVEDNIVIVPQEVEPLNRQEAREYLEKMAKKLDMVVSE